MRRGCGLPSESSMPTRANPPKVGLGVLTFAINHVLARQHGTVERRQSKASPRHGFFMYICVTA